MSQKVLISTINTNKVNPGVLTHNIPIFKNSTILIYYKDKTHLIVCFIPI